jgi:hypothetical protein
VNKEAGSAGVPNSFDSTMDKEVDKEVNNEIPGGN